VLPAFWLAPADLLRRQVRQNPQQLVDVERLPQTRHRVEGAGLLLRVRVAEMTTTGIEAQA
jgi:hypothetical protein